MPLGEIEMLIAAKSAICGSTVTGMPLGSSDMEIGESRDAFDVVAFATDVSRSVFAKYLASP